MTHDELLAKINDLDYVLGTEPSGDVAVLALRAVVELHKPDGNNCPHCAEYAYDAGMRVPYPCPTIQAIEKELK